ncbi:MAG: phage holin family protein [Rhodococcus sp.]|uniref:phage holin family protein n=1 Tax=Rhodococcus TaxID=1827 RepID=UPI0016BA3515|nr:MULTISPECIES: phage holin family protein [Rhodococcus]NLV78784.1 phage holin family protein [Rhodococcus sp. (in: high G+C Gram-positive bacteria)]
MISLILRLIINAVGLWLAARLVSGIVLTGVDGGEFTVDTALALLLVALIFTVINALVKPIVKLLSLPLVILTLGLFTLVINALMLWLTSWVSGQIDGALSIDGFWAAFWGAVIISIVNLVLGLIVPDRD